MADPMTAWASADDAATVRDAVNQNFDRRAWNELTAIDDTDSPYTVLDADEYIAADATSGVITVALPAAASHTDRVLWIEGVDVTSVITIDPDGAELINGASTKTIGTAGRLVVLRCDGTGWTAWYMDRLP